ncbi:unnamed protein product [marine sediment metagenome]|uniref:Uncharacterized protein n=1 Tax=marine sediment metagenome TaxID=412755 RepID=X1P8D9_9ZZZZ
MKSRKLYNTYKEINLRKELKKKYKVQESMLTGHTPVRLYPPRLNKIEISSKKTNNSS